MAVPSKTKNWYWNKYAPQSDYLQLYDESTDTIVGWIDHNGVCQGSLASIGGVPTLNYTFPVVPSGTIGGGNPTFILPTMPISPGTLLLFRNGIFQIQGFQYTLSGTTITFQSGWLPLTNDTLVAL